MTTTSYSNPPAKIMKGNKNLQNILIFEQIQKLMQTKS